MAWADGQPLQRMQSGGLLDVRMPVIEGDISTVANLLIKRHGDAAVIQAARRADDPLAEGDLAS